MEGHVEGRVVLTISKIEILPVPGVVRGQGGRQLGARLLSHISRRLSKATTFL